MSTQFKLTQVSMAVALALGAMGSSAWAQQAAKSQDALGLDEVVVTATTEQRSKMKQSLSISTLGAEQIQASGATSSADILRSIPGIRSEASGGEGNANVSVRGIPVSAGGSRYVSQQENGLPVLLLGDFNFVTPDMFVKPGMSTDSVEVVRGGSASTTTSNGPGGVVNFISKTGDVEGGSVAISHSIGKGLQRKADFGYGKRLSDTTTMHVGGFIRGNGEGPRANGDVDTEKGGGVNLGLAKSFGGGDSVKLYFKYLNDTTPTYLPVPVRYENGKIVEIDNVDPRTFTPYNRNNPGYTGAYGSFNVNDGLNIKSTSIGGELNLGLGDGWVLNNKARLSMNSGTFAGALPLNYGATGNNPDLNQQSYVVLPLTTQIKDAGNAMNDLRVSKGWNVSGSDKVTTSAGLFMASQKLNTLWGLYQFAAPLPANGSSTFGPSSNVYDRSVDLTFETVAPYASVGYETGPWAFDAGVRHDKATTTGSIAEKGEPTSVVDLSSRATSFSVGANYSFSSNLASFVRVSEGSSMTSDRYPSFGSMYMDPPVPNPCFPNCLNGKSLEPNTVRQYEVGAKYRQGGFSSFLTLFKAETSESNVDFNNSTNTNANDFEAKGAELELGYRSGGFRVVGGVTYTDAEIVNSSNAALVGLTPNRQAKFIYQVTPTYSFSTGTTVGGSIIGTTSSRDIQDGKGDNGVELPAYTVLNAFVSQSLGKGFTGALSVNNLTNEIAYTEANGDRAAARALTGRTVMATVRYDFE